CAIEGDARARIIIRAAKVSGSHQTRSISLHHRDKSITVYGATFEGRAVGHGKVRRSGRADDVSITRAVELDVKTSIAAGAADITSIDEPRAVSLDLCNEGIAEQRVVAPVEGQFRADGNREARF